MSKSAMAFALTMVLCGSTGAAAEAIEGDTLQTSAGPLVLTVIGHGSVMMSFDGKIIHVDPFSRVANYSRLPDADVILITHHHSDHLDPAALEQVRTERTVLVLTEKCAETVKEGVVLTNGDVKTVGGVKIEVVPAYNLIHKRDDGTFFHPKGEGNGYVITFAEKRVYVAGDTENTPEMKELQGINVAFLPMNLPYTMTPEMVADAASAFKPNMLYPYHYGENDPAVVAELLKDSDEVEVRVR